MDLTLYNYLQLIKQIKTGTNANLAADGGFLVDEDISPSLQVLTYTSTTVTGSTSTLVGATVINGVAEAPAVIPSTGSLQLGPFHIPRGYDQTSDTLQWRFLGVAAGSVTEPVAAWLTVYAGGNSTSPAVTTAVQNATTTFSAGLYTPFAVNTSGNGLVQDDVVYLSLSTSTAPITLYGGAKVYANCQVAWDEYGTEKVGTSTQQIRG